MPTIKYLPVVDRCCLCVKDLKLATYLIGIYSMFDGLSFSVGYVPLCKDLHSKGALGTTVRTFGTYNHVAGLALFGISIALIITTWQGRPITTLYVFSIVVARFLVLVFHILSAIYSVAEDIECEFKSEGLSIIAMFLNNIVLYGFVQGCIAVYFVIVVNSYGLKVENLQGASMITHPPSMAAVQAASLPRVSSKQPSPSAGPSRPPSPSSPPHPPDPASPPDTTSPSNPLSVSSPTGPSPSRSPTIERPDTSERTDNSKPDSPKK